MFKPQKSSETNLRKSNRVKLDPWTRTPTLDDIRQVLETTRAQRGIMFEVTIRRDQPPAFVLTCQWEVRGEAPVWSLYEGEDGSKTCWSYPNDNLEMIYEIICMSLPGGLSSSEPAKMVGKAAAMAPKNPDGSPIEAPAAPAAPAAAAPPAAPAQPAAPAAPYAAPGQPYPAAAPGYPAAAPGYPQPYPQQMPPGAPAGYPPGYPMPQQAYPPNYPPPGYPQQYPAYPPGYPQGAPPPGWGQPGYPAQYQMAPGQAEPHPGDLNRFNDLLNKGGQGHMLLGQLFTEAGVIPEPCLESALKLQELVRKGLLSNAAAIEAMKRASERGGMIDDDLINACKEKYPQDSLTHAVPTLKPSTQLDPKEFARQVIQLLQQSGIVSETDVATAEAVRKKHGGDVGAILVAAGKVEKNALDAAKRCLPLVREHRLNHEEAFRILRHCQKTKVTADEAFQTLSIHVL